MSQAQEIDGGGSGGGENDQADIEARARLLGWKPREEYRGPDGGWRDAAEFVAYGERELPVTRERNRVLERRLLEAEKQREADRLVLLDLSERTRKSEERGYLKAKAELERLQREAVATGDIDRFDETQREIAALEAAKPAPAPVRPQVDPVAAPASAAVPEEVLDWGRRNEWFMRYPDLNQKAQRLHMALLQTEPELTLADNLNRVSETMRDLYPDLVGGRPAAPDQPAREPGSEPAPDGEGQEPPPRRSAPAVLSSRGGGGRAPGPRSYEAMPKEAKEAYDRFSRMISGKEMGKGKPLTREEFAKTYWDQFEG